MYILNSPSENNLDRRTNMNTFFNACLVVFQSITMLFPKTAVDRLKEIIVTSNIALTGIKTYCDHIKIDEITMSGMNELLQKLNDVKLTKELELKEKSVIESVSQYFPPPENFRELTVYPTVSDLECEKPYLRPNISKGAYEDVEHYLDVQFRLLREDFIAPLREGIQFYKRSINDQQNRSKKNNNIRIYFNVNFEKKGEFFHDKNGFVVHFDKNKKLNINWEMAKRFLYGSLLLFSMNDFRTFFLGVVLERKIEFLQQGKLVVELLENVKPIFNKYFTMVESEVFFEPYKCSMEVLKTINCHNFPMEKYIVSTSNEIDRPLYINLMLDKCYLIDNHSFDINCDENWPSKEQLGFDIMQYQAFKAALTQEFTVIQGPPGTGKTFIGLKIMEAIVNNLYLNKRNSFNDSKLSMSKPILVVCYTNHALDQFMEGILSFTKQVVRIGNQSKSEIIEEYSLKNIVRMYRRSVTTKCGIRDISDKVKSSMGKIKYFRKCREVVSRNKGILELSLLKNGMPKSYHCNFQNTLDLLSWLFQDFNYFSVDPVKFIQAFCSNSINEVYHSEKLLQIENEVDVSYGDIHRRYEADNLDFEVDNQNIIIYTITLDATNKACNELFHRSVSLEKLSNLDLKLYNNYEEAKFNFDIMRQIHNYFKNMLSLNDTDVNLPRSIKDLNKLSMRQRWRLYFYWVNRTQEMFDPKIAHHEEEYTHLHKQYSELKELENIEIFKRMHVVALTTTGAAKHRIMLEGLESPIVVVEEAAEVLEAHIVSSLTKHCQHLILIGDHKQLRPSNAVYKLAKDFKFDISLFERMVNNNVPCYTLGEQHRMRPEISSLITPTIYSELKNHVSVYDRKHVCGVTKDLFFLNHNVYEIEVEEILSKTNEHEAKFLIMLARYLILQGYTADQVTILTTYKGQLFYLRNLQKKHSVLNDVKIMVVDNYQGEESDIILLSLVRSNEKGNVGFLKVENRVCVALSRAKYGLYIMGNMDNLYNSSNLWKEIKETLITQDAYGNELILECAVHSGIKTKVSKSEDFNSITEGGCTLLCKSLMSCGHYCSSICHPYDREHLSTKCLEPCNKSCGFNHPCIKRCFMDCGKCTVSMLREFPCGHQLQLPCFVDCSIFPCEEKVEVILEDCGHQIIKKCHEINPKCTFKCFDRLDCGHACNKNCHKNDDPDHNTYKCSRNCENINKNCSLNHKCQKLCYEDCSDCTVKVDKILPCGHKKTDVPCGLNDIKCILPCDRLLKCNHKCRAKCFDKCKPCEIKVSKIIPDCGHSIEIACKTSPQRNHCTQICNRTLDCGHKCKNLCAKECTKDKCKEIILQKISKLACGHDKVNVLCCDKDRDFSMDSQYLLDKCSEPCLQKLNCNDICQGMCGQCKQGRLHVPCNEPCNKINVCNHSCQSPCKERCPPCYQKCLYSCVHSKCPRKCGLPCVSCKENCNWRCPHLKCTKKCGEICNRKPCYEFCKSKLKCGHVCIGFCGEPCPPLCRICHNDEVTAIIFGNVDDPDARFVYLEDCGHSIESEALEKWINQNDEEIALKQCPLCKTPILKTQRFMNRVKFILKDIALIKHKLFVEQNSLNLKKNDILKSLKLLNDTFYTKFISKKKQFNYIKNSWDRFVHPLLESMYLKKNKHVYNILPSKNIESIEFVVDLFESTSKYKKRIEALKERGDKMKNAVIDHFAWLLSVAFTFNQQLSKQQKFDISMEMVRGGRILSYFEIRCDAKFHKAITLKTPDAVQVETLVFDMKAVLMSWEAYNSDKDNKIQNCAELIQEKISGISVITDKERKMIHAAMSTNFRGGLRAQGHWCKCSNGHIYCITECGGPMEISFCPECKVEIGGTHHRYVQGTSVASEMDGAVRFVWSSGNQIENYVID